MLRCREWVGDQLVEEYYMCKGLAMDKHPIVKIYVSEVTK